MPCSHCGSTLPPGAGRCPVCGRPAEDVPAAEPNQVQAPAQGGDAQEAAAFFQEILSRPASPPEQTSPEASEPLSDGEGGEEPPATEKEESTPAEPQPPAPRRRRWLPIALGGGALVLLVAAALVIRFLLQGESQPVFYLSQNTLYYCYNLDAQPQVLLEGVEGGAIALTAGGESAVLVTPDGTSACLYWLDLGREAGITQVDTGLEPDLVPLIMGSLFNLEGVTYGDFHLDETGVLFYQKPTQPGSRRMDLYRCDGGAPQLLKENVGDTLYHSPDGSALLVEQYGEDRGLIRRSAQPGGEEELICAGEEIRVVWSDSDGFSQILYTVGNVFDAAYEGGGLTLYRWTPEEGSQALLSDLAQVVRAEGTDNLYYTRGDPSQMVEVDAGDYVVSKPLSALYHWQDGTETLVCEQVFQCHLLRDDLLLYWTYIPGMSDLSTPLAVLPIGGEPVILEGLWGGAALDEDNTLYGLEDGGTLVRYTQAGGYTDRTELAAGVGYYALEGERIYFSCYEDGSPCVYRLEGEKAVPVVEGEENALQVNLYQDGAALIYLSQANIPSPPAVDIPDYYALIYQTAGGSRIPLKGEISAVQRLEGDDLLVLNEEGGSLTLYREGQTFSLAQGVDDFCAPGAQEPFYQFNL